MKTLSSFRLSESTKQNLKYLSKKFHISQADLISLMCNFVEANEFDFATAARTFKTENNPAFKKFKSEFDKLNRQDQKIIQQQLIGTDLDFDEWFMPGKRITGQKKIKLILKGL